MNQGFILGVLGLMSFLMWGEKFRFEHIEISELKLILHLCWMV